MSFTHRDRLILQRLQDEIGNHAAVVHVHARPVSVENSRDTHIDILLFGVRVAERLRDTFALVVAGAWSDWIHVAPIGLWLRVHVGIAVHFGCAGDEHLGADAFRQPQHVDRAHRVGLDGLHRIVHIMGWRCRTGQVIDLVHLDEQRIDNVVMNELEVLVAQPMLDVAFATGEKIVCHDDFMALHHQLVDEMRTDEAGAARDLQMRNKKKNREKSKFQFCFFLNTKMRFRFL